MRRHRTVAIPTWAYDNACAARGMLARRGFDALPKDIRDPAVCPSCDAVLTRTDEYVTCPGCGYVQGIVSATGGPVGLGFILGLGVAALVAASKRAKPRVKWHAPRKEGDRGCGHVPRPETCSACTAEPVGRTKRRSRMPRVRWTCRCGHKQATHRCYSKDPMPTLDGTACSECECSMYDANTRNETKVIYRARAK